MSSLTSYKSLFDSYLKDLKQKDYPKGLYAPIDYLLNLGGKRLRPVLTLIATEAFGKDPGDALPASLSVEVFHNFTLMHDDIMDAAPLRRGKPTVHVKWDISTGILSGDVMLIQAYQYLEDYPDPLYRKLNKSLSKTAIEVCKGQQFDMDFETQNKVTISAYLEMIKLKTAVLIGCSLQLGAWIGKASDTDAQIIYDFGVLIGLAFQIQDDYLDAFGDPKSFGKQIGGDIIENKKTILYHKTMELGTLEEKQTLTKWFKSPDPLYTNEKIEAVKALFESSKAAKECQQLVAYYTQEAFKKLDELAINNNGKVLLKSFGQNLMERKF
jgi:geranylgeranyl diphosphate synthase type II